MTGADATGQPWRATVLTLFPEMFPGPLGVSLAGKALAGGLWTLNPLDIREFARDKHRSVDDTPFGGGAGMVMRPDVVDAALASVEDQPGPRIYLSPRGRRFDQARAKALAAGPGVVLLCGRYEGLDERVIVARGLEELSLGDFVLSGGEPAAIAVMDAVVRLLPGGARRGGNARGRKFRGGAARISPLHPASDLERHDRPRGADQRSPRQRKGMAAPGGGTDHAGAAPRSLGPPSRAFGTGRRCGR